MVVPHWGGSLYKNTNVATIEIGDSLETLLLQLNGSCLPPAIASYVDSYVHGFNCQGVYDKLLKKLLYSYKTIADIIVLPSSKQPSMGILNYVVNYKKTEKCFYVSAYGFLIFFDAGPYTLKVLKENEFQYLNILPVYNEKGFTHKNHLDLLLVLLTRSYCISVEVLCATIENAGWGDAFTMMLGYKNGQSGVRSNKKYLCIDKRHFSKSKKDFSTISDLLVKNPALLPILRAYSNITR